MNGIVTKVYIDTHSAPLLDLRDSDLHRDGLSDPIKVAIADPHALFRDGLRRLLAGEPDFQIVAEASTASLLLPDLSNSSPDIVLISTPMEGENSADLFAALQAACPAAKLIVLSGANGQDEFVKNVRLGARGIVQKSTSGSMLVKAIRKVQDGEFWLDRGTTAEVVRQFTTKGPQPPPAPRGGGEGRMPALSRREREIVNLVTQGLRNRELAERLCISEQTVKNHMHNIFDKLGVSDRLELALYAIHHQWHETE